MHMPTSRPVALAVELDQPDVVLKKLHRMKTGNGWETGWGGFKVDVIRVTGQDRWLIRLSAEDLLHLTFSLEVQEDYLVVSNLPMTYRPRITGRMEPALHHMAAMFNPAEANQTKRAFEMAALDQSRQAVQSGLGVLYAFHWSGITHPDQAMQLSRNLFGFTPVHPAPGNFVKTPEGPASSTFGTLDEARQPALDAIQEPYGSFPNLRGLDLTFQFEQEGLRTRITWELQPR